MKFCKLLLLLYLFLLLHSCSKGTVNQPAPSVNSNTNNAAVSTFVGNGVSAIVNGVATNGSFIGPSSMAIDGSGNFYVMDGSVIIRKITPGGVITNFYEGLSTGSTIYPHCLNADALGNVYLSTASRLFKITPSKTLSTIAGNDLGNYGKNDGTGNSATFNGILSFTMDKSGNFYLADTFNGLMRKVTSGGAVTTIAGNGIRKTVDGIGLAAGFNYLFGICIDSKGNLFVSDQTDNIIRKITPAGVVTTFAGSGSKGMNDGIGTTASFYVPADMAVDASDNIYVSDRGNSKIRKITPDGVVTTVAGTGQKGYQDGPGLNATFSSLGGIVIDAQGSLYVTDTGNYCIRKVTFK